MSDIYFWLGIGCICLALWRVQQQLDLIVTRLTEIRDKSLTIS